MLSHRWLIWFVPSELLASHLLLRRRRITTRHAHAGRIPPHRRLHRVGGVSHLGPVGGRGDRFGLRPKRLGHISPPRVPCSAGHVRWASPLGAQVSWIGPFHRSAARHEGHEGLGRAIGGEVSQDQRGLLCKLGGNSARSWKFMKVLCARN